jgi:serine/threonine protein phosphatase PrpC
MDEEEVVPTETAQTEQVETEETTEEIDWKAEADKKEQAFQDQKKRAEKAERALKDAKAKPEKSDDDLSTKDILALSTAGIADEEDIEVLQKAAKINGTTLAQAIKDPIVQAILKGKQEERQTALAASTTNTRRVPHERTGTDLLSNAAKGVMPENKTDIQKLVRARIGLDK